MYQGVADFSRIDLDNMQPLGYENDNEKRDYQKTIDNLKKVKTLLDKADRISEESSLPAEHNALLKNYQLDFVGFVNQLEAGSDGKATHEYYELKTRTLNNINNWVRQLLDLSTSNKFLFLIISILGFQKEKTTIEEQEFRKIKAESETFFKQSEADKNTLLREVDDIKNRAETTLKEIQDKSSTTLVSNYAKVFQEESKRNRTESLNWLIAGISLSILTLTFLILILLEGWFSVSEKIVSQDRVYYVYDFSKMLTKFLVISILVFIISYSFRKYSVNKHLETINRHRQNALNSYLLLAESIIGNDSSTRNNLMLHVAKAIYEHSSTGFLSGKHEENSSGLIEVTKIIGDKV